MGACCSGGSAYAVSSVPCLQCGLRQDVPTKAPVFACDYCRAGLHLKGRRSFGKYAASKSDASGTLWNLKPPAVGAVVRLSPCCLYYDHKSISSGPLKSFVDEAIVTGEVGSEQRVVEAKGKQGTYRAGCIEEASDVKLHDELFANFASRAELRDVGLGDNRLIMGYTEFNKYVTATTNEPGTWEIYESVCHNLQVHPTQGLTSGDFRRMYCEFEGDLQEDHRIAFAPKLLSGTFNTSGVSNSIETNEGVRKASVDPDAGPLRTAFPTQVHGGAATTDIEITTDVILEDNTR